MRCECGAHWRTNYPHGYHGGSIVSFIVQHDPKCYWFVKPGVNPRKIKRFKR